MLSFLSYASCFCHSLAVEKYPGNRMLGQREIVNGKVYGYCFMLFLHKVCNL